MSLLISLYLHACSHACHRKWIYHCILSGLSSSTSNDAFNGAISHWQNLWQLPWRMGYNKIVSQKQPWGTGIPISRLPFTNERFANFIYFGRGDRHQYNFFLCINDIAFFNTCMHSYLDVHNTEYINFRIILISYIRPVDMKFLQHFIINKNFHIYSIYTCYLYS